MDTAIPTTDTDTMVLDTMVTITAKGPQTLSPDMDTDMVTDMATLVMDTMDTHTITANGLLTLNPKPSRKPKLNPLPLLSPDTATDTATVMVIPMLTDTDTTTVTIMARDP